MKDIIKKTIEFGNPIKIIKNFLDHRFLIGQLTRRDISIRYKGSYLGLLWSIINPLVMLIIYTFVFSVIFKSRWRPTDENVPIGEFAITIFAGLIPFTLFSEVVNRSSSLVINNINYVKKVVFPLEVLVVVALGSATFTSMISIGVLLVASLIISQSIPATVVFLPLLYIPLILLTLGISWFIASLGVYIRDVGQVVALIMQILFFMSPIFYPSSSVPAKLQFVEKLNPIAMIVENFRNVLLWGQLFPLKPWIAWTIITGGIALLGYIWFMATKKGFADVI